MCISPKPLCLAHISFSGLWLMPRSTISPVSKTFTLGVLQFYLTRKLVRITRVQLQLFQSQACSSAGQDATEAFYGLHRHEVLQRPQYKRLQIGTIQGQKSVIYDRMFGEISQVPYAEPTWLTPGYFSPYYSDVRKVSNLFSQKVTSIRRTIASSKRRSDGSSTK